MYKENLHLDSLSINGDIEIIISNGIDTKTKRYSNSFTLLGLDYLIGVLYTTGTVEPITNVYIIHSKGTDYKETVNSYSGTGTAGFYAEWDESEELLISSVHLRNDNDIVYSSSNVNITKPIGYKMTINWTITIA